MNYQRRGVLLLLAVVTSFIPVYSNAQNTMDDSTARESLALTVYNNDLGVVRDVRKFSVPEGMSDVQLRDVPTMIDPTTVKITAIKHPDALDVIEQNYEYDLLSQEKLLEKYVDKSITVGNTTGVLLAAENDKITLRTPTGIRMLTSVKDAIDVPNLSSGLITRPTLLWKLNATRQLENEPLEVLYQTHGMSWHAEYIAALSGDDKSLDLTGWVSIQNNSGASYPDAQLKLVAGNLHTVSNGAEKNYSEMSTRAMLVAKPQFQEHGMFEYHVYDLQRKTSIMNNEEKQVSLLTGNGVAVTKHYTYSGGTTVGVTIDFVNSEANHLGIPIPMGTIRVMKRDNDGSMEFVGEDHIEHTPRDEKITLHVGDAFDLVGERLVTDSRNLGPQTNQETIEITLKNHKDQNVTIDAIEQVGGNWDILKNSMDYEKKSANEIIFHVPVPARGEQKVRYTIIHHWG